MPAFSRIRIAAALAVSAAVLVGCAGEGVELNGKIFDVLGVSDAAQKSARTEPKLKERTGLVVPPNTASLPEPGSGGQGEPDVSAQLNDPDRKRQLAAIERARLHKAYCSGDLTWKERAIGPRDAAAGAPVSPYGSCGVLGDQLKQ